MTRRLTPQAPDLTSASIRCPHCGSPLIEAYGAEVFTRGPDRRHITVESGGTIEQDRNFGWVPHQGRATVSVKHQCFVCEEVSALNFDLGFERTTPYWTAPVFPSESVDTKRVHSRG